MRLNYTVVMISVVHKVLLSHSLTVVGKKGVDGKKESSSAQSFLKILPEFANGNCLKFATRAYVEESSVNVYC